MTDRLLTADRITDMLRDRHSGREWAFFAEMRNATGFPRQVRTFDAWAMNTWPSKGYRTLGYEIKVSRSDFLHELEDPTKRAALEKVAGECYFATPAGLLRPDEVPEGWGLIVAGDSGFRVMRAPMQRQVELSIHFVAALLRRASDPENPMPAITAWEFAGRPLTMEGLRSLVAKVGPKIYALERERIQEEAHIHQREQRVTDGQRWLTAAKTASPWIHDPPGLERWVAQHKTDRTDPELLYSLHAIRRLVGDMEGIE